MAALFGGGGGLAGLAGRASTTTGGGGFGGGGGGDRVGGSGGSANTSSDENGGSIVARVSVTGATSGYGGSEIGGPAIDPATGLPLSGNTVRAGNVGLTDGSVQGFTKSSLQQALRSAGEPISLNSLYFTGETRDDVGGLRSSLSIAATNQIMLSDSFGLANQKAIDPSTGLPLPENRIQLGDAPLLGSAFRQSPNVGSANGNAPASSFRGTAHFSTNFFSASVSGSPATFNSAPHEELVKVDGRYAMVGIGQPVNIDGNSVPTTTFRYVDPPASVDLASIPERSRDELVPYVTGTYFNGVDGTPSYQYGAVVTRTNGNVGQNIIMTDGKTMSDVGKVISGLDSPSDSGLNGRLGEGARNEITPTDKQALGFNWMLGGVAINGTQNSASSASPASASYDPETHSLTSNGRTVINNGALDLSTKTYHLDHADAGEMQNLLANLYPRSQASDGQLGSDLRQGTIPPKAKELVGYDDPGQFIVQAQVGAGVPLTSVLPLPHFGERTNANGAGMESEYMKKMGSVVALADRGKSTITVTAPKDVLPQIDDMLRELDNDTANRQQLSIVKSENANPQDVLGNLQDIFANSSAQTGAGAQTPLATRATSLQSQIISAPTTAPAELNNKGIIPDASDPNKPVQMVTRTFKVDPATFVQGLANVQAVESGAVTSGGGGGGGGGLAFTANVAPTAAVQKAVVSYFKTAGVDLTPDEGKAVIYNDRTGTLTVHGSEADLAVVSQAVEGLNQKPPEIKTAAKFVELPQTNNAAWAVKETDKPLPRPAAPADAPQPEVRTRDNAFSTFSLNVADVAFKLAAASLEKGQMPEAASVRSEEFLNAFNYRDPAPPPGVPIAFASERARWPFAQNRDLIRFSVQTAAQGREPGRPLNLVLLLDNSGSMERADRVATVRAALRVLAAQLQAADTLSVITFARAPRLWVDGIAGSEAASVIEQVLGVTPEGGTNLEEAMKLAYATAARHYLPNGVNRVVLMTDGAANLGNVDPVALKQRVEAQRKQGIALDCFGVGWEGYNDDLLEVLARNGDGRYSFINTPEEAATDFAAKLAGALHVAASDVKVQVEFNPARVIVWRQIGYAKHQLTKEQFRDNTVDAAELAAAESGNALYLVEVNPAGTGPLATVRVRFKVPGTTDYREHAWDVPFNGSAISLAQASPAMRLAATASAFAEWLVSSPYAAEVTPDALLGYLRGVPEICGADPRPKQLEWMIRQAGSLTGK